MFESLLTPEQRELRDEVRAFVREEIPRQLILDMDAGEVSYPREFLEAAARQMELYPHGVYWLSLAPLRTVEAIVPTVADALGFTFYGAGGSDAAVAPRQQLLDYLGQRSALLLFDNFEHLLEGIDLVSDILQAAPEVKVLAPRGPA